MIINNIGGKANLELPPLTNPAPVDKVVNGYEYINTDGTKSVGTMTDRGAVSQTLAFNCSYTIPEGYHNGSGKVTQSITTKAAATYGAKTSAQTIAAGQYLGGAQTIAAVTQTNLTAANIVKGKTVTIKSNGSNLWSVSGTAETNYSDGKYYIVNNGTLGNQVYGGKWKQQSGYVQVTFSSSIGYVNIGNYIDLTDFSTLTIELSSVSVDGTSRTRTFYIMNTNGDLVANVALKGANVSKTATIDVSSLTGFHLFSPRSAYSSMRIKNLYLS